MISTVGDCYQKIDIGQPHWASVLGEPFRLANGPKGGEFQCYHFNRHDVSKCIASGSPM